MGTVANYPTRRQTHGREQNSALKRNKNRTECILRAIRAFIRAFLRPR